MNQRRVTYYENRLNGNSATWQIDTEAQSGESLQDGGRIPNTSPHPTPPPPSLPFTTKILICFFSLSNSPWGLKGPAWKIYSRKKSISQNDNRVPKWHIFSQRSQILTCLQIVRCCFALSNSDGVFFLFFCSTAASYAITFSSAQTDGEAEFYLTEM